MADKTGEKPYTFDNNEDPSTVEDMTVTVDTVDGVFECSILGIFEYDGRDYIAIQPMDENGQNEDGNYWIYRYSENFDDPNEEPELDYIDDDDELEGADKAFQEYYYSVEHDEIL